MRNIVVQAGGNGSRAGKYARNKPKCLISAGGKPLIFHICDNFPEVKIYVIFVKNSNNHIIFNNFLNLHKDYQSRIHLILTDYQGSGDASFLRDALNVCEGGTLICWSDILFKLPEFDETKNVVFVTDKIECRWKIHDRALQQQKGEGILGCFYISNPEESKQYFLNDGTIIETLKNKDFHYEIEKVCECKEFGLESDLTDYYQHTTPSRYYNNITILENTVEKSSLNKIVIDREINWYNYIHFLGFTNIPKKLLDSPLTLEKINGSNVYEHLTNKSLSPNKIFDLLDKLHNVISPKVCLDSSLEKVYVTETMSRIERVTGIHEVFSRPVFDINGGLCDNVIRSEEWLRARIRSILVYSQKMVVSQIITTIICLI